MSGEQLMVATGNQRANAPHRDDDKNSHDSCHLIFSPPLTTPPRRPLKREGPRNGGQVQVDREKRVSGNTCHLLEAAVLYSGGNQDCGFY